MRMWQNVVPEVPPVCMEGAGIHYIVCAFTSLEHGVVSGARFIEVVHPNESRARPAEDC